MSPAQRKEFTDRTYGPFADGLFMAATVSPAGVAMRGAWAVGGWRALLGVTTKELVEEGVSRAFQNVTGIPLVVSPMDMLRAARKGSKFIGNLADLKPHERQRAAEYLQGGSVLERTDIPGTGGADFRIDGKLSEFKSLQGESVNHTTGLGRLQEATKKPGVQVIDLDIRTPGGTSNDATTIYDRFSGTDQGKSFLGGGGEVRIATQDGLVSFGTKH